MSKSTTTEDGFVNFWFGYFMDGMSYSREALHKVGKQIKQLVDHIWFENRMTIGG